MTNGELINKAYETHRQTSNNIIIDFIKFLLAKLILKCSNNSVKYKYSNCNASFKIQA